MKKERGFSLLELITVVAILGIIMALAVPGLFRAKRHAQSGSAIQSLRTITTAEHLYDRRYRVYATLADLVPEGSLDSNLGSGAKSGYTFTITLSPDQKRFSANANPQFDPSGADYFYVDETAVIRHNNGAPADATSQPIPR
jgi:prepilin-type N-terminal cleavage/methylation domain-containing protein